MRVNVYSEEQPRCFETVSKNGYVGLAFVMEGSDSSVTFWGESEDELKDMLRMALDHLGG